MWMGDTVIKNFRERVIIAREDKEEAARIISEFEPLIKKCIRMYVKDNNSCEDALQEGRVAILGCIRKYDTSSHVHFEGYVKMAVIYCIRNFASKHRETMSLDEETEDGRDFHDILNSGMDVEGEEIQKEDIRSLKAALEKLTDKERNIIKEFYFEGKTMREMSRGRRCHYMTVVKNKERVMDRLRREMGVAGSGF
jgi:RNA polymerase sporulation-specific sigma factor